MEMNSMFKIKLYLGLNTINNQKISTTAIDSFIVQEIVPILDCFSIHSSMGYWKGQKEENMIIELIVDKHDVQKAVDDITYIGETFKEQFMQEAVLITNEEIIGALVQ